MTEDDETLRAWVVEVLEVIQSTSAQGTQCYERSLPNGRLDRMSDKCDDDHKGDPRRHLCHFACHCGVVIDRLMKQGRTPELNDWSTQSAPYYTLGTDLQDDGRRAVPSDVSLL
jgi:hypothetical protein